MRNSKAKALRKIARSFAINHIKSLLNDEEAAKVTVKTLKKFEKGNTELVWSGSSLISPPYSSRSYYKILKKGFYASKKAAQKTSRS